MLLTIDQYERFKSAFKNALKKVFAFATEDEVVDLGMDFELSPPPIIVGVENAALTDTQVELAASLLAHMAQAPFNLTISIEAIRQDINHYQGQDGMVNVLMDLYTLQSFFGEYFYHPENGTIQFAQSHYTMISQTLLNQIVDQTLYVQHPESVKTIDQTHLKVLNTLVAPVESHEEGNPTKKRKRLDDEKRRKRMERNRVSAQDSRRRKKEEKEALEHQVSSLEAEQAVLKKDLASLKIENKMLKSQFDEDLKLLANIPGPIPGVTLFQLPQNLSLPHPIKSEKTEYFTMSKKT